jgi:hypothetical protein
MKPDWAKMRSMPMRAPNWFNCLPIPTREKAVGVSLP